MKFLTLLSVIVLFLSPISSYAASEGLSDAPGSPVSGPTTIKRQTLPPQIQIAYGGSYKAGSWFPWGWCTYEVSRLRGGTRWHGNARDWLYNSQLAGVETGSVPKVGAVMVEDISYYGHVSYVTKVNADGSWNVQEMNYAGFGVVSHRKLSKDYKPMGFIY